MKHMKEVAKMLGVEMGERFKIKNSFFTDTYWFEWWGIAQTIKPNGSNDDLLNSLLNGNEEIVKLPFKPQKGEKYWVWRKDFYNAKNVFVAQWIFWCGDITDRMFYMLGNCYRTEQECLADTAMKARVENMERCKW